MNKLSESDPNPEFLYRYRHLEGVHKEWTKTILTESKLYFTSPENINDPFDCKAWLTFDASPEEKRKCIENLVQSLYTNLNQGQRTAKVEEYLKKLGTSEGKRKIYENLQGYLNKAGILSLSRNPKNILMWSYYSWGHQGLCLQFKTNTPFFRRAIAVNYLDSFPKVSAIGDDIEQQAAALLFLKSNEWKHEEEWRIVDPKGSGIKLFPEESLTGVILGYRMPQKNREAVRDWLKARPVTVHEATIIEGSFKLDFIPPLKI